MEKLAETMKKLQEVDGINVELCGSWLWIDGETYEVREQLKKLGCKWSRNKQKWYWHDPDKKGWSNGKTMMADIRAKYGSQYVKADLVTA